jgi:hypothetical protein
MLCEGGFCVAQPGETCTSVDAPVAIVDAPVVDAPVVDAPVVDAPVVECTDMNACDDSNPCTQDLCISNQCHRPAWPNSTGCDDGLFCNGIDSCQDGICIHSMDACPIGTLQCDEDTDWCRCDDGVQCTGNDRYQGAICTGDLLTGTFCGAGVCDDVECNVCCSGVCRDMRQDEYCAGCSPCLSTEDCVYSAGRACGWSWCCS